MHANPDLPFAQQVSLWRSANPVGRLWADVVFSGRCGSSFSIKWEGNEKLVIECTDPTELHLRRNRYEGIAIEYRMPEMLKERQEQIDQAIKEAEGELQ